MLIYPVRNYYWFPFSSTFSIIFVDRLQFLLSFYSCENWQFLSGLFFYFYSQYLAEKLTFSGQLYYQCISCQVCCSRSCWVIKRPKCTSSQNKHLFLTHGSAGRLWLNWPCLGLAPGCRIHSNQLHVSLFILFEPALEHVCLMQEVKLNHTSTWKALLMSRSVDQTKSNGQTQWGSIFSLRKHQSQMANNVERALVLLLGASKKLGRKITPSISQINLLLLCPEVPCVQ